MGAVVFLDFSRMSRLYQTVGNKLVAEVYMFSQTVYI